MASREIKNRQKQEKKREYKIWMSKDILFYLVFIYNVTQKITKLVSCWALAKYLMIFRDSSAKPQNDDILDQFSVK